MAAKITEYAGKPMSKDEKRAQIDGVAKRFNWDKIAEETLKVYRLVLG